jgi:poly(3-hydroxybutyrate) depolymerase
MLPKRHTTISAFVLAFFCTACQSRNGGGGEPIGAMGGVSSPALGGSGESNAGRTSGSGGANAAGNGGGAAGRLQPRAGSGAGGKPSKDGAVAGTSGGAGGDGVSTQGSSEALARLNEYLAIPKSTRPDIATQSFAKTPLNKQDAEQAKQVLWDDFAANVRQTRAAEVGATESAAKSITVAGSTMKYYMATRGSNPSGGRSLFISMHGGGNAPAATNDSQWENQVALVEGYDPQDALWIAPRAPSNEWNMWFTENVDALFERLITNMIVFEKINPNKVYLNGYSAGGDAVYQLGPRMAECWAGAGMSAGHPNDASPLNLRNVAFAIHVGGNDTGFDRNLKAEEWGKQLEELAAKDPGGYPNQWQLHAGLPHWMEMADAVSIPFLQGYTRNPLAPKVVWRQRAPKRSHFYWLAVDDANQKVGAEVHASYTKNTVTITNAKDIKRLTIRFSDTMMNLDESVRVEQSAAALFSGTVPRTIAVIARTLEEHGDPTMIFYGEVAVDLK